MSMKTLEGLGWQWRQNGVILCVQVDGRKQQVFVPLNRVWHEFHKELAAVGCPLNASVGDPITVAGFFGSIAHAVKSVAHAVTSNAVTKAAANVASTATNYAVHAISKVPVIGSAAASVARLMTGPINVADALAKGGRIDRVAMNNLKSQIKDLRAIAPYAQTVLSFVPGVGTGLSGAIGAGLALAAGQSITDAVLAGVRGALPGGAVAQAAFDVGHAAMLGRPVTEVMLNAIPGLDATQKRLLVQGVQVAKLAAAGKPVAPSLLDGALKMLPPAAQKAVQIGTALAHAKSLQGAVGNVAQAANLQNTFAHGVAAALQLKSLPAHVTPPPSLTHAVQRGLAARAAVTQAVAHAQRGVPGAAQLVTAVQFHKTVTAAGLSPHSRAASGPIHLVRPRYHTKAQSDPRPSVGALWPSIASRAVVARAAERAHPHTHPIAALFQAHAHNHHAHHGQHVPSFMATSARIFQH